MRQDVAVFNDRREYARRRSTCEQAAVLLGVSALRDVAVDGLRAALDALRDPLMKRRVRHVVTESVRVLEVVDLLRTSRLEAIGPILTASHVSLRDEYEVSSRELDLAVDTALAGGALGARMTGGGFGGSAIALAGPTEVDSVRAVIESALGPSTSGQPKTSTAVAANGASRLY